MDKDHNQMITGNSKLNNNKFLKNSQYRKNRTTNYQKAKESIITGVKPCIESWCDKHDATKSSYFDWKKSFGISN